MECRTITNKLTGTATYEALLTVVGAYAWVNYEVSADVKIVTGSATNEAALVVRCSNSANFYCLGLGCYGHQYSILKCVNGIYIELDYYGVIGDVDQNVVYTLKAVCNGSTLELWVDGTKVLDVTDTSLTSGTVGLRGFNSTIEVSYWHAIALGSSENTFGTTTVGTSSTTFHAGIPRAVKYTPPGQDGTVTALKLYLTGSGAGKHVKVALYADNAGTPDVLLCYSASTEILTDGWHTFSGFTQHIDGSTPYWLSAESDSADLLWYYVDGGADYTQNGDANTYGTFPNPFGTLLGASNYNVSFYAVYTPDRITPNLVFFSNLLLINKRR
jgi:hypothetical protein